MTASIPVGQVIETIRRIEADMNDPFTPTTDWNTPYYRNLLLTMQEYVNEAEAQAGTTLTSFKTTQDMRGEKQFNGQPIQHTKD